MKTKKSVRVAAVLFSMTMLAGYVVHSQLEHSRNIASSSKAGILRAASEQGDSGAAASVNSTNNVQRAVAPGSKSLAPVLQVRQKSSASKAEQRQVAPGSKSAAVFNFEQAQVPEKTIEQERSGNTQATNRMLSAKP